MLSRIVLLLVVAIALVMTATPAATAATLRAPAHGAPANGATVDAVPAFTWSGVRRAVRYEFQVAADSGFGSIVGRGAFRTLNTAATLQSSLPDGTYFWRVRAIGANDKAGRWSPTRSFEKVWSTAPQLLEPGDALSIVWPSLPLVLRWTAVPHATTYHVTIASDPSLANPVIGTVTRPLATQGMVFALPGALAPGRYYWAVTPVDAGKFKGRRSRVGSFLWGWPTGSAAHVLDLDPTAGVFDPLLQWDPVPGASSYEVEINITGEFTPGSKAYSGIAYGTSLAPTVHLPNNSYHWRVRAIDPDGNAGVWNAGPVFKQEFDDVTPTVPNVRVRDHDTADLGVAPITTEPMLTWDPVPGATRYELQFTTYSGSCNWFSHFGETRRLGTSAFTPNSAWAAGTTTRPAGNPGGATWPRMVRHDNPFLSGESYCVRIAALDGALNASEWTEVNGRNQPAFTYQAPAPSAGTCSPAPVMPQAAYREPTLGSVTPRTPFFAWSPVPSAASYFVVVARDPEFTEVVDYAFTRVPVYAPRTQYADETTSYYWAVIPAGAADGTCGPSGWTDDPKGAFQKRSIAPALVGPADDESVPVQPLFRWRAVESADKYRLQVATDPEFGELLDDVMTASTAYASTKAYPADARLYWRVRANSLNWSPPRSFRRRLPVPAMAANPGGGETIPVLAWHPVQGAVSYDMHVDQSDGTTRDFNMRSTRFTPILFYGTGIWRWKVRANFPGNVHGGYTAPLEYVRRLNAPAAVQVSLARNRMLFTWSPDRAAATYRLQISSSDSFGSVVDNVTTPLTSYAPLLTSRAYVNGGKLWWRLAVVDPGGNVGAYTTGIVALPRAMTVQVQGSLTRGRRGTLLVTVRDAKGRALRNATVTASGAGARARKRTGRKGTAPVRVRPSRRGTVTIRVTRKGFKPGLARVGVGSR